MTDQKTRFGFVVAIWFPSREAMTPSLALSVCAIGKRCKDPAVGSGSIPESWKISPQCRALPKSPQRVILDFQRVGLVLLAIFSLVQPPKK